MALALVDNDAPVAMPLTSKDGNPAVVETYGEQVRQSFLDRPDKLHFRIQDTDEVLRLFGHGRGDNVREVEESRGKRHIVFAERQDLLVDYTKQTLVESEVGNEESTTECYTYKYSGKTLKSTHISLRPNQCFDLGADTPAVIFRQKALHIALKFNETEAEENPHRMIEVLQDQNEHSMRIIVQKEDGYSKETLHFDNDTPNDSDVYLTAKQMIAQFIQQFVEVERELFLSLPEFVPGETDAEAVEKQRQRLQHLAKSLFTSIDDYTADPNKRSDRLEGSPPRIEAPREETA